MEEGERAGKDTLGPGSPLASSEHLPLREGAKEGSGRCGEPYHPGTRNGGGEAGRGVEVFSVSRPGAGGMGARCCLE